MPLTVRGRSFPGVGSRPRIGCGSVCSSSSPPPPFPVRESADLAVLPHSPCGRPAAPSRAPAHGSALIVPAQRLARGLRVGRQGEAPLNARRTRQSRRPLVWPAEIARRSPGAGERRPFGAAPCVDASRTVGEARARARHRTRDSGSETGRGLREPGNLGDRRVAAGSSRRALVGGGSSGHRPFHHRTAPTY
ncbi:uncharacterized protein [Narcine bancroftii]|uniref:uncharacterized protein isoform X2 n=1 Tax=Narcine bancroftii TaxID=1343680 RepID=UPI0038312C7A